MKSIKRSAATSVVALAALVMLGATALGATLAVAPANAGNDIGPAATLHQLPSAHDAHDIGTDAIFDRSLLDAQLNAQWITSEERARLDGLMAIWLQALPSDLVDSFLAYLDEVEGATAAN